MNIKSIKWFISIDQVKSIIIKFANCYIDTQYGLFQGTGHTKRDAIVDATRGIQEWQESKDRQ